MVHSGTKSAGLMGRRQPPDLGQEHGRHRDHGLIVALGRHRLIGSHSFFLGPSVQLRRQALHALHIPARWKILLVH